VRLVPFEVRIPDYEQDRGLRQKLLAEAPGILAWLLEGCRAWQRDGLGLPQAVQEATAARRCSATASPSGSSSQSKSVGTGTAGGAELACGHKGRMRTLIPVSPLVILLMRLHTKKRSASVLSVRGDASTATPSAG
jgi:hypothetical protein